MTQINSNYVPHRLSATVRLHNAVAKKHALTPWFLPGTKPQPQRKGVYMTEHGFQKWNGKHWGAYSSSIKSAAETPMLSAFQNPAWCGLKDQPVALFPGL